MCWLLFTDSVEGKLDFIGKKLYRKQGFEKFHLTIRKQPVYWPFSSLLDPVDSTLEVAALEGYYSLKHQNVPRTYIPINWDNSSSLVSSLL